MDTSRRKGDLKSSDTVVLKCATTQGIESNVMQVDSTNTVLMTILHTKSYSL